MSFQGSVFQSSVRVLTSAIRPELLPHLYLPVLRPHVSVSQTLLWALASWGILPIGTYGWFPAPVVPESHRWVTPFRASTLRGLRSVLYAGSRIECRLISIGKPGRGTIPFWACLSASFGRLCLTTPHHTFTCVDHSRVLGGVVTSGSRLMPFHPRFRP
jgi:hypothetical protein